MKKSIPTPTTETPTPDAVALPSLSSLPSIPTIPNGWEEIATMVDQCIFAGKRLTLWISMLIAEGREKFDDPSDWIKACTDRWGWDKAHLHHINTVGRLLLSPMSGVVHAPLCELEFEKVLAIARLPNNLIGPFLEKARPQDHSRDEVRAAVTRWRIAAGEPTDDAPAPGSSHQPRYQPDFMDALFDAPPPALLDIHAWQARVQERASAAVHDADTAADVFLRSLAVCDAMVERMRGKQLIAVAANLRLIADAAEKQAATQKALTA